MALNSASTDAQVEAAYDDNASYLETNSRDMAAAFVTACRILLRRRAQSYSIAGRSVSRESIETERDAATKYLQSRSNGRSRINRVDFLESAGVD